MTKKQFYFQFHITEECNLRCRHCYQNGYKPDQGDGDNLLTIAKHITAACNRWGMVGRIALTGGEPFLSPHLWSLLDYFNISEEIITITVLSNGTTIDESCASRLRNYSKLREVQISVDGSSSERHDAVRGEGAFDRAITGIHHIQSAGIPVALMFTLMRGSSDDVEPFLIWAKSQRVSYVTVERVVHCRNESGSEEALTAAEVRQIYTRINEWYETQSPDSHQVVVRRGRPLWSLLSGETGGFCPAGFASLAILQDGTILPCRRLEIAVGNVLADGGFFRSWYTSEVLWKLRNRRAVKGQCGNCKHMSACGGCRAIAHSLTGDYMETDPQCWFTVTQL